MTRDQINAKYRRDYDKLYVASMMANDAAESEKIDASLAALNKWRENQLAFVAIQEDGLGTPLEDLFADSEQAHEARVS